MTEWLFTFAVLVFTPDNGFIVTTGGMMILQGEESPCEKADKAVRKQFQEHTVYTTCDKLDAKAKPTEYKRGNKL